MSTVYVVARNNVSDDATKLGEVDLRQAFGPDQRRIRPNAALYTIGKEASGQCCANGSLAANAAAQNSPPPMPLTASPATETRAIPSSWTASESTPDGEALEALEAYKKKDPNKGAHRLE